MDYVNLALSALNEVSGSTWIQWAQGSAVLGSVAVTAVLTWVVKDLWDRVDWLWHAPDLHELANRVTQLEIDGSTTRHRVNEHEKMLQHMAAMRAAKAAKKAKAA